MQEEVLGEILNKVNETNKSVKGIETSIENLAMKQDETNKAINIISENQEKMASDIAGIYENTKELNERVHELEKISEPTDSSFGIK